VTARSTRVFLVLLAALALAACSRIASMSAMLAYSNATPLLSWMVGDYVELEGAQKAWVHARFDRAMAWHRENELPRYRRFLASASESLQEPVSAREVGDAWAEMRGSYDRVVEHVLPDVADFLLALDAEQLGHLERAFAKANRKVVKEGAHGTPEERRSKSIAKAIEHFEEWTGPLTESQRAIVAAHRAAFPDTSAERLADRKYRQAQTLALVRAGDRAATIAGLRRLLVDPDASRSPAYVAKLRARDALAFEMIAQVSATLSTEQRGHLRGRIGEYMADITRLAEAGD